MESNDKKVDRLPQSLIPRVTLKEALSLAEALRDNFAAKSATPLDLAKSLNRSPSSSDWRYLTGASTAYGLTTGAYNAAEVILTEMGRKIVMPTEEGEDKKLLIKSALNPQLLKQFYERYDRNKFPRDDIAKNVIVSMGVPQYRADEALKIIKANGLFIGIIVDIGGNNYIQLSRSIAPKDEPGQEFASGVEESANETAGATTHEKTDVQEQHNIFISHSENSKILDQIKTLLELGGFKPTVAEEQETTAIPVPQKIIDQMRECTAAVINVSADQTEKKGDEENYVVNQNVLIEIGAAFVLYDAKVILVWDKRVAVPSNLQGLYRCEYEGDELSWSAGTRLQKALLAIKQGEKPSDS